MKRIVIAVALTILAFGFRTTGGETKTIPTTTTTTVVVVEVLRAHDALQEDLTDPSAFGAP